MKNRIAKTIVVPALLALSILGIPPARLHAQGTIFTYQGRVTDNGTNYTGVGLFKFVLVTSTNTSVQATATPTVNSGFVTSIHVVNGGSGYNTAPLVTITGGGGSNAVATAQVSGGLVTNIVVNNPGAGYGGTPTVTVAAPPASFLYTTWWSNDGTSSGGSEPATAVSVVVANGLFTVVLGDTTQSNMAAISATLFNQAGLQLRIWFNDGVNGSAVLTPVQNLTPAPYAVSAMALSGGLVVQGNASGAPNVIAGAPLNYVSAGVVGATISGGGATNYIGVAYSNSVTALFGTVSGGAQNTASGAYSTVGGGYGNTASGGGGSATVGGGYANTASGNNATVGGGGFNTAGGAYATIPGGGGNAANGADSFAAGSSASALHNNSFVWSDGTSFSSVRANEFAVHAFGGVRLAADLTLDYSAYHNLSLSGGNSVGFLYAAYASWGDGIHLGYNYGPNGVFNPGGGTSRLSLGYGYVGIYVGSTGTAPTTQRLLADTTHIEVNGTFNNNSDRNAKQDFAAISPSQMLERITQLPLSEWSYKDDPTTRHVGPMAQDFYSIFNLGTDNRHIAPIDEGGVAFAAIQGLNQKLNEKDAEIQQLKQTVAELQKAVSQLAKAEQRFDSPEIPQKSKSTERN